VRKARYDSVCCIFVNMMYSNRGDRMGSTPHLSGDDEGEDTGGVVIPLFPNRDNSTPPPLPRLASSFPMPGGGHGMGHGVMFGAAITRRFQDAA
jgi:hypothetical protein